MKIGVVLARVWVAFAGVFTEAALAAEASEPTEADFAECMAWYQQAGFERLDELPFVRVRTGWSYTSGSEKFNPTLVGFLKDDAVGDGGKGFEVLSINRNLCVFERNPDGAVDEDRVEYEVIDFADWIADYLKREPAQDRFRTHERGMDRLTMGGVFSSTPSTPAVTALHLAVECEQRGLKDESRRLFARVPTLLSHHDPDEQDGSLVEKLESELGHVLMWQAVVDCDHPENPRQKLLEGFRRVLRIAPGSRHAPSARQFVERLEIMIEEDVEHTAKRKAVPFDELSDEDQIKDLVFQLRDQDGAQWSQPGSCSVFSWGESRETPADKLVEIGFPAVPHLIDALVDPSLTYSVGFHRDFYFSHRVLTVADAAQQVIEKITGARLPAPQNIRVFGNDPDQNEKEQWRAAQQEAALKWWLEFEAVGEKAFLIREVGKGGPEGSNLAKRLLERYPDEAFEAVVQGLDKTSDSWGHYHYTWAIGSSEHPDRLDVLRRVIDEGRFGGSTMAALEALRKPHPKEAVERACKLLDLDSSWESEDDFGDTLAEDLFEFLIERGDEAGLQKIRQFLERLGVGHRVDLALGLYSCEWKSEKGAKAVEEMLALLVEDTRRRTGMSGSVGDLSYSDPRVCDLAAEALKHHWPDRYSFDFEASMKVRNRQCLANANVWRKSAGKPLLESDERVVEPMSREAFAELIRKHPDPKECFAALEAEGVRVVPYLVDENSPLPEEWKERAAELAGRLGNRVERIRILPEGSDYPPVTRWAETQQGKPLDGDAVVRLISSFFKRADAKGEAFRGLEFEALRHEDLTGIDVTLRLKPRERPNDPLDQWNGDEEVTLGTKSLHTAGYGGGLSKDDPEESADLGDAVDQAVAAPLEESFVVRWKLTGWWHDD